MPRIVSTQTKIEQLSGLLETDDLNDWEHGFVEKMVEMKRHTDRLTNKQLENLERLYFKHFA